jgi:hypothetical protein
MRIVVVIIVVVAVAIVDCGDDGCGFGGCSSRRCYALKRGPLSYCHQRLITVCWSIGTAFHISRQLRATVSPCIYMSDSPHQPHPALSYCMLSENRLLDSSVMDLPFISDAHANCSLSFLALQTAIENPVRDFRHQAPLKDIIAEEFDKYKLWAGNVGAAHCGDSYKISLDYRLREASFYKTQVSWCHQICYLSFDERSRSPL